MNQDSFDKDLVYSAEKVSVKLILESSFSKEIRILLKKGQEMKEHKAPYPIVIHLIEGEINFGIDSKTNHLSKGDIITLEGNVPHNLIALKDSIVRLTLSKSDQLERVVDASGK